MANGKASLAIAVFLILSIATSILTVPIASAHSPPWQFRTHAYVQALPNPIGAGQSMVIYVWLDLAFGAAARQVGETRSFAGTYNNYRFHNYQVVITAPNGDKTTQNFDIIMDTTSSQQFKFTPTQVGTYIINFSFPGQAYAQYPGGYDPTSVLVNDTYSPASASTTLTVQEEPIPEAVTGFPLPTSYWARPIYGENSNWYTISSDWLGTGHPQFWAENYFRNVFVPDAIGPETSHVMWTKLIQNGGIVGGNQYPDAPGVGYFEGSSYNQRFTNPIIMDGYLYYTEPVAFTGGNNGKTYCVDLRTGQVMWSSTQIPAPSFGYIYNLWNGNQHGTGPAILFTNNFGQAFDAFTGYPLFNVTGVPAGTAAAGPNGEQLRYVIANAGNSTNVSWYLSQWNSSRLWGTWTNPWTGLNINSPTLYNYSYANGTTLSAKDAMYASATQPAITTPSGIDANAPAARNSVVYGNVMNPASSIYSYDWNVSLPWLNTMGRSTLRTLPNGTVIYGTPTGNPDATNPVTVIGAWNNDMLLCRNGSLPSVGTSFYATSWTPYTYFAVNLNKSKAAVGSILWMKTYNPPAGNLTVLFGGVDPIARVFYETHKEEMRYIAYSMETGEKLWGPTDPQPALDYYGNDFGGNLNAQLAYGKLYSVGFAGILYCRDQKTGELLWTYGNGGAGNTTYAGFATAIGSYPTFIAAIANGIVYMETTEHTILNPIYKGSLARAVNATDGKEIWTLSAYTGGGGGTTSYAVADGYATWFNGYDNSIYVVGRGPSATTVEAPKAAIKLGESLIICGTVTDISSGTEQNEQIKRFPNGVPVASDDCMADWMSFVYQQKPLPASFKGVEVAIDVVDSNNNYRNVGKATTDSKGFYSLQWTPDIEGKYTVIASFAGTKGYWSSSSETAFAVDFVEPSRSPEYPQSVDNTVTIVGVGIALLIAVAIGFAVVVMMLRKRA